MRKKKKTRSLLLDLKPIRVFDRKQLEVGVDDVLPGGAALGGCGAERAAFQDGSRNMMLAVGVGSSKEATRSPMGFLQRWKNTHLILTRCCTWTDGTRTWAASHTFAPPTNNSQPSSARYPYPLTLSSLRRRHW